MNGRWTMDHRQWTVELDPWSIVHISSFRHFTLLIIDDIKYFL